MYLCSTQPLLMVLKPGLLQSLLGTQITLENLQCMSQWSQRWVFVDGCVGNEK